MELKPTGTATVAASEPPRVKPHYRVRADGTWILVSPGSPPADSRLAQHDVRPGHSLAKGALPDIYGDWHRALLRRHGAGASLQAILKEAREDLPDHDPFIPLAQGYRWARERETVLWEDHEVMVVVDAGSDSHFLVTPKQPKNFPTDCSAQLLQRVAHVAAATADAYKHATASAGRIYCWVNPPHALSVRQMHCHVSPQSRLADSSSHPVMGRYLAQTLGASQTPPMKEGGTPVRFGELEEDDF